MTKFKQGFIVTHGNIVLTSFFFLLMENISGDMYIYVTVMDIVYVVAALSTDAVIWVTWLRHWLHNTNMFPTVHEMPWVANL